MLPDTIAQFIAQLQAAQAATDSTAPEHNATVPEAAASDASMQASSAAHPNSRLIDDLLAAQAKRLALPPRAGLGWQRPLPLNKQKQQLTSQDVNNASTSAQSQQPQVATLDNQLNPNNKASNAMSSSARQQWHLERLARKQGLSLLIQQLIRQRVTIELRNERCYTGELVQCDPDMSCLLRLDSNNQRDNQQPANGKQSHYVRSQQRMQQQQQSFDQSMQHDDNGDNQTANADTTAQHQKQQHEELLVAQQVAQHNCLFIKGRSIRYVILPDACDVRATLQRVVTRRQQSAKQPRSKRHKITEHRPNARVTASNETQSATATENANAASASTSVSQDPTALSFDRVLRFAAK